MNPLEVKDYNQYDFPVETQAESDFPVEKPVEDDFPVKIDRYEQLEYAFLIFMVGLCAILCGGMALGLIGIALYGAYVWVMTAPLIAIPVLALVVGGGAGAWTFAGMDLKKQAKKRHENQ